MSKDDISSSSESDEANDLFKEAANCDYIVKLYNNDFVKEPKKKKVRQSEEDGQKTISTHQAFIAKSLMAKLEDAIKIVESKPKNPLKKKDTTTEGIRLFSDSVYIDSPQCDSVECSKRKAPKRHKTNKEYYDRAKDVSVSTDWVLSKTNTACWRHHRKSKVINMKVRQKLPGQKMDCVVLFNST